MKGYSSFVSELTIEYLLIPALTKILKQQYTSVIPVFPWLTREGSKMSKNIHQDHEFRVIGLYPRRPKLDLNNQSTLYVKVKDDFFDGVETASKVNIPLIVGCPLIKSLWDLDNEPECLWIKVDGTTTNKDYELPFDIEKGCYDLTSLTNKFNSSIDLLNFITEKSDLLSFAGAINAFKTIRDAGKHGLPWFNSSPKQVYFLLGNFKTLA